MDSFEFRNLNLGDTVIVMTKDRHYGKMCTIIETSETNGLLPVKVKVVNPHDDFGYGVVEKWIPRIDLQLIEHR